MTDTIALTGMNMFHITRELLLSIAAKIITYELFLMQLKPDPGNGEDGDDLCKL
jgi:hypothetical protein